MVPSDVTWHQPKQTNYGAEWRHAARKWTAQLPDKCTLLHDFDLDQRIQILLKFMFFENLSEEKSSRAFFTVITFLQLAKLGWKESV